MSGGEGGKGEEGGDDEERKEVYFGVSCVLWSRVRFLSDPAKKKWLDKYIGRYPEKPNPTRNSSGGRLGLRQGARALIYEGRTWYQKWG